MPDDDKPIKGGLIMINIGDKVKVIIKDDEIGGRIGRVVDFERFPFALGVDVKFSCGTICTIPITQLRREE